jgi:hypothetical protein
MSVAEMKLVAIAEISKLQNEVAVQEILKHLKALSDADLNATPNLSKHFDEIEKQYGNVLKKLAQ